MELLDMNRSWTPPEGFKPDSVSAEGAYLRVNFSKWLTERESGALNHYSVTVYVNDMGREVMRTTQEQTFPAIAKSAIPAFAPGRWFRFQHGFYLALEGLQEMIRCLSISSSR